MRPTRSLAGILLLLPVILAAIARPAAAPAADDKQTEPFTLAVVRRDAIAIPFATYDGKRWKTAWPVPAQKLTIPISLTDIPKAWWSGRDPVARWTMWTPDGKSQPIDTLAPAWVPAHCQQTLGLRTSYKATVLAPPPHIQPYPKDGLAVSGTTPIERIEVIDPAATPIASEIARTVADDVGSDETLQVNRFMRDGGGWTHPYREEERKTISLQVEALYRVRRGHGDLDVYYFEGVKRYLARDAQPAAGSAERPCDLVTFVSGWFARSPGGLEPIEPLELNVRVTSCDYGSSSFMLPLGVVRVVGKPLWVVQFSGWTQERYAVIEVHDTRVTTPWWTSGGHCIRVPYPVD
jgi:hypothetical protein